MNHSSVSEVVMVFSLGLLILRRFVWAGALNAADVWVHPLMALHRMAAMATAMLAGSNDRDDRRRVAAALGLCLVSVVLYRLVLAPPTLGRQEAEIFIAAKGVMVHTSPFVQPWSAWVETISLLALAGYATRSFTAGLSDDRFRLVWWTIGSGVVIALLLSALTHVMQLPFLIRLQPMRIFMLPWFGAELLIGIGAVRGFLTRDSSWPWMAAVIATSMLHGGLHVIVTAAAAMVLMLQVSGRPVARHWLESRFIFGAFVTAVVAADLASVRSIHFTFGTVVLVVVFLASILESRPRIQATGVLAAAVVAAGVSSWMYFRVESAESTDRPRVDPEYNCVLEWIRDNTPERARFATEPGLDFFRTRSLRTSVNETISAIVWVDPHQSVEEMKRADAAMVLWQEENLPWEHEALNQKSTELNFEYVLTRKRDFLGTDPEFTSGPFHVFRVR